MDEHDDLVRRLRHLGTRPIEPVQHARDLRAMAAARQSRPLLRAGSKLRLAGAFLAGLLIGSTGLAAADALPDPAQHVAHTVLGRVGVDVPDPERYHGPECGAEVKRNHGGYVRNDPSLAQSDCGKPVRSDRGEGDEAPGAAKQAGPCQGKPSWAGDKSLTPAEKAAAQAERIAQCGSDDDAAETTTTGGG